MQWSKIRSKMRELIAPELQERVDFHLTNYRKHSDHNHELWITLDQHRIFSASYCRNMIEECVVSYQTGLPLWGDGPDAKKTLDILTKREIHDAGDVVSTFRTYLDLDPQIALSSSDPVLKALAVLDKRIGKRTLKALKITDDEHSLVRIFYSLRMQTR